MQEETIEDSTLQLLMDQMEELVVTLIEEIRARPAVVLAIVAAVVGAAIGARLAAGPRRRGAVGAPRMPRKVRSVGDMAELAGIGFRLLQNPIVRGLIIATIERQLKRQLAR